MEVISCWSTAAPPSSRVICEPRPPKSSGDGVQPRALDAGGGLVDALLAIDCAVAAAAEPFSAPPVCFAQLEALQRRLPLNPLQRTGRVFTRNSLTHSRTPGGTTQNRHQ